MDNIRLNTVTKYDRKERAYVTTFEGCPETMCGYGDTREESRREFEECMELALSEALTVEDLLGFIAGERAAA